MTDDNDTAEHIVVEVDPLIADEYDQEPIDNDGQNSTPMTKQRSKIVKMGKSNFLINLESLTFYRSFIAQVWLMSKLQNRKNVMIVISQLELKVS